MKSRHLGAQAAFAALSLAAASGAFASPMTYSGYDAGVLNMSQSHVNSSAQKSLFSASLVPGSAQSEGFNYGDPGQTGDPLYLPQGGESLWSTGQGNLTGTVCNAQSNPTCHTEFTQTRSKGGSPTGRFDTTGAQPDGFPSWWFETDQSFSIAFGGNYSAFGFYSTDAGDFGGTYTMTLVNADNTDGQTLCVTTANTAFAAMNPACQVVSGSSNGGLLFFGFTDSSTAGYKGVRFNIVQGADTGGGPDIIGFDDLVLGQVAQSGGTAPEPASLALVALGLVGAGMARRKTLR